MPNWSTRRSSKPKPSEDLPDFGEDFLELLRQIMPQGIIPTGWPLYRRGGSYRHWTTPGDKNYVPTGFTQIGVYRFGSDTATAHVRNEIMLPRRYTGDPLAWGTILSTTPDFISGRVTIGTDVDRIWVEWWTEDNVNAIVISWLTMGPGAGQ